MNTTVNNNNIEVNYRIEIVRDFNNVYYVNMTAEGGEYVKGLPEYVGYMELKKAVKHLTGCELPTLKSLTFEGNGRKKYAHIERTGHQTPKHKKFEEMTELEKARMMMQTIQKCAKESPELDWSEIQEKAAERLRKAEKAESLLQVGTMVRMPGVRGGLRVEEIDRKGDRVICKSEGEKHEYNGIAYFVAKAEEIRIPEWLRIGKYFHISSAFGHERVLCTAIEPNNDPEHPVIIRWAAGKEESSIVLTSALDEDNQEKVA